MSKRSSATSVLNFTGSNTPYAKRGPERLVLEGYRHLAAGYQTGSIEPWEIARSIYRKELEPRDATRAFGELSEFMRALNTCARCPLRLYPFHSEALCLDECLSLGLIASLQHGDHASQLCLQHLSCPFREDEIERSAKSFAMVLDAVGQRLLPVPASVIGNILTESQELSIQ
ncbi:MAG: hypothetical protein AAGI12_00605 [Pseudomonadota bacterium]